MQIETNISNVNGRYQANINTSHFTAAEEEKLQMFGEPLVEMGGEFSGSVVRPGQTDTTVTINGNGSGAVVKPVLDAYGSIVAYTIEDGGENYTSATVAITGDGTGATATATVASGAVTAVTPGAVGSGYHQTPVSVEFEFPEEPVRLKSDFPFKRVFDLADTLNADAQAKLWLDTIVTRLTAAKNSLMGRTSPLEGRNVTTV